MTGCIDALQCNIVIRLGRRVAHLAIFTGGRARRKLADRIFERAHSIPHPQDGETLPILIEDNPSREFFFPISSEEARSVLKSLPEQDSEGITHIWLRRTRKADFIDGEWPIATFICGSGVRLITLYAWPNDMTLRFGQKKPSARLQNEIVRFGGRIRKVGREWIGEFTLTSLRKYCVQGFLFHEIGHHVDDYYRLWSKANRKKTEDFADQYAVAMTAKTTHVLNWLDQAASTSSTNSG